MSDSNKTHDARRLNIPIISESDLHEILNPLVGVEGTYTCPTTGKSLPCCVALRSNDFCFRCNDTKLVVTVIPKQQLIHLQTCKCNLKLNIE